MFAAVGHDAKGRDPVRHRRRLDWKWTDQNVRRDSLCAAGEGPWISLPLASSRWRSVSAGIVTRETYEAMANEVSAHLKPLRRHWQTISRTCILLGIGTVTTVAGIHLGLLRYDRRRVDGLWMNDGEIDRAIAQLMAMTYQQRADNACIGTERADLVLAGCAILDAIRRAFPLPRLRVADRGLREGMLVEMMRADSVMQSA